MWVDFDNAWQLGTSVCSFAWNRICASISSKDAKHFQGEAIQLQRAAEEYETDIGEAQILLQNLSTKSARLVCFFKFQAQTWLMDGWY